jgi:hypothetical protein
VTKLRRSKAGRPRLPLPDLDFASLELSNVRTKPNGLDLGGRPLRPICLRQRKRQLNCTNQTSCSSKFDTTSFRRLSKRRALNPHWAIEKFRMTLTTFAQGLHWSR